MINQQYCSSNFIQQREPSIYKYHVMWYFIFMPKEITGLDQEGRDQFETMWVDVHVDPPCEVRADRIIDVTDISTKKPSQAIIKFWHDSMGQVVEFHDRYEADVDLGMSTGARVNEGIISDNALERYSDIWGVSPNLLVATIIEYLPRNK